GENAMDLFRYGLPTCAEAGIITPEHWDKTVDGLIKMAQAAGKYSYELFMPGLGACAKAGIIKPEYWDGLVKLAQATGENAMDLFRYGLPTCAEAGIITPEHWDKTVDGLIKMAQAVTGEKTNYLFNEGLTICARFGLLKPEYWDGLIKIVQVLGERAYTFLIFQLAGCAKLGLLKPEYWDDVVRMVEATGKEDARELFEHGLPAVAEIVNEKTWPVIVKLVEGGTIYLIGYKEIIVAAAKGEIKVDDFFYLNKLIIDRCRHWGFRADYLHEEVNFKSLEHMALTNKLLLNKIFPTKWLLDELEKAPDKDKTIKEWVAHKKKDFDPGDKLRVELEYSEFRRILDYSLKEKEKYTYNDFIRIVKEHKEQGVVLTEQQHAELMYTAYEVSLVYKFLKELLTLRYPLLVVPNMRYGQIVGGPLEKKIRLDFEIARIGSTECHENFYYIKSNLFSRKTIVKLLKEKPILVILDGTEHVIPGDAEHYRFPDAFVGYTNYITAFNLALGYDDPKLVKRDSKYMKKAKDVLAKEAGMFSRIIGALPEKKVDRRPYKIYYKHFCKGELTIRKEREVYSTEKAFQMGDIDLEKSVPVIFVNGTIPSQDIPGEIRDRRFPEHKPAYFDDKDKFISTLVTFTKKGVELNRKAFFKLLNEQVDKMIKRA
ncbi:hypothetical protein KY339_04420, partial [Candidatus Woesearchaeota archaeon]|nr:hypothetical protein [Candidatus Woesearchaeota archaeon]